MNITTRRARLASDYRELMSMAGPILKVTPLAGVPPYCDEYELEIHIRSIVGPEPTYRSVHKIRLSLPRGYPLSSPRAVMMTRPFPYHTNWFSSGAWCNGVLHPTEGLGDFVVRMMQTLQFRHEMTNVHSPARTDACLWYQQNKHNSQLFPSDTQTIPQPSTEGMEIGPVKRH